MWHFSVQNMGPFAIRLESIKRIGAHDNLKLENSLQNANGIISGGDS